MKCDISITSERLRALRAEKKINGRKRSQAAAAAVFGVSDRTYKLWELGQSLPDTESLLRIAAEYGVSCDYLLGLSDVKTPGGAAVCSITGLTPGAVDRLSHYNRGAYECHLSPVFSAFLEHDVRDSLLICNCFENYVRALSEVSDIDNEFEKLDVKEALDSALFTASRYLSKLFETAAAALRRSEALTDAKRLP